MKPRLSMMTIKRIYHHWEKWECCRAGFYATVPPDGMDANAACVAYREFLADIPRFERAMQRVINEWPNSCEQFLSNVHINRIAWLGQAAMCIETGVPSCFRAGFKLLTAKQQTTADAAAARTLQFWMKEKYATKNSRVHRAVEKMWLFG